MLQVLWALAKKQNYVFSFIPRMSTAELGCENIETELVVIILNKYDP